MDFTHQQVPQSLDGVNPDPNEFYAYPNATEGWDKAFLESKLNVIETFAAKYQVPVYIGEFSAAKWAQGADLWLTDVMEILESRNWIWTAHAWRSWQGWNHELNTLFFKAGDPMSIHELVAPEISDRLEAIKDGLSLNP